MLFGRDHLATLAAIALVAAGLLCLGGRDPRAPAARRLRLVLAACLLTLQVVEDLLGWRQGWLTPEVGLPLHLCDLALVLAVVAHLTLAPRAVELVYLFALAGTLPALITPELDQGFPGARFLVYFAPHGMVVASALLLVFRFRIVPAPGAWWRAFLALNAWALLATPVNLALDTNFLYLRAKPSGPTPYDWFGPWPWYIATLEAAFLAVFWLLDRALAPLRRRR